MELDDIYEELLVLVSGYGAQVDTPIESEHFFETLSKSFTVLSLNSCYSSRITCRTGFVLFLKMDRTGFRMRNGNFMTVSQCCF